MKNSMLCLLVFLSFNGISQSTPNLKTIDSLVNGIDQIKLTSTDSSFEEDTQSKIKQIILVLRYYKENKLSKWVGITKTTYTPISENSLVDASYSYFYDNHKLIKVLGVVHEGSNEKVSQIYFNNDEAFDYSLTINGKKIETSKNYSHFKIFLMNSNFFLKNHEITVDKIN